MTAFETARSRGLARLHERRGIGTWRSKPACNPQILDRPDEAHHEVPLGLGRLVADVFDGGRV